MTEKIQNSRRGFIKASAIGATGIGIGFVAASEPVMAAAIETDFVGLKVGEQMIPVGSFQLPAYVSRPEKVKGSLPIVIVASEIFGVHEYIADEVNSGNPSIVIDTGGYGICYRDFRYTRKGEEVDFKSKSSRAQADVIPSCIIHCCH